MPSAPKGKIGPAGTPHTHIHTLTFRQSHSSIHADMHTLPSQHGSGKASLSPRGSIPGSFQEEEDLSVGERAGPLLWLPRAWALQVVGSRGSPEPSVPVGGREAVSATFAKSIL